MLTMCFFSPIFWGTWCLAELLFFAIIWLYVAPRMNRLEPPPKFPIRGKRLVSKVMEVVDWLSTQGDASYDFSVFLGGWFLGTPASELRRDNVVVFLAWAMYAKESADLSKSERRNVSDAVKMVEKRLGRTLEPGTNPDAVCIRHTLEPVIPFSHRPLVFYVFVGVFLVALGTVALNALGFRRRLAPCGTFSYWFREAFPVAGKGANGSGGVGSSPIVFFHGVGVGLLCYLLAIWRLCRGRTAVIVESPSIMMSLHLLLGSPPPAEARLVDSVERIMERHGLKRATFFGHSFGSVCVAWMVRRRPNLVSQVALLDPVCLLLFLPDVASSFLFPNNRNMPPHEKLLVSLISREMGISHTLRRHFWWYTNTMWPEDVQCPVVVGLAGMDKLVPVQPLRRFLLSHPSISATPSAPRSTINSSRNMSSRRGDERNNGDHGMGSSDIHETGINGDDGSDQWDKQGVGKNRSTTAARPTPGTVDNDKNMEQREGDYSGSGGAEGPKRVEVVFWPEHGHGSAMADPGALEKFDRICRRQEQAFVIKRSS